MILHQGLQETPAVWSGSTHAGVARPNELTIRIAYTVGLRWPAAARTCRAVMTWRDPPFPLGRYVPTRSDRGEQRAGMLSAYACPRGRLGGPNSEG